MAQEVGTSHGIVDDWQVCCELLQTIVKMGLFGECERLYVMLLWGVKKALKGVSDSSTPMVWVPLLCLHSYDWKWTLDSLTQSFSYTCVMGFSAVSTFAQMKMDLDYLTQCFSHNFGMGFSAVSAPPQVVQWRDAVWDPHQLPGAGSTAPTATLCHHLPCLAQVRPSAENAEKNQTFSTCWQEL